MTSDHLFPVLENEGDSERLVEVASLLAVGRVPEEIIVALRLGRLTALSKPDGGVRRIVVGDILRRMVARTIAKQIAKQVEAATAPFQYALSTKAGCECVAHMLQSLTDLNPEVTVTSIDGVGAYDLISRSAMLEGLLRMEGGDQILPFVRMFCSNPSTYLWEDELGITQHIAQGEGGENGDPLMPMLFALAQHQAPVQAQARLSGDEKLCAFLDDIYITSLPGRATEAPTIVGEELWTDAGMHLHHGKTKVWNRGGVEPENIAQLTRMARLVRPDAVVWRGEPELPRNQQGLRVLGVPIGQPEFVRDFLEVKTREQATLFQRIPWVQDTQAAFLLLLMCGSTRANFWLRSVQPDLTEGFAERHDTAVWGCLRAILGTPSAPDEAQVPVRRAAHVASWADTLSMVRQRHLLIAETMIRHLEEGTAPCFQAVWECRELVEEAGLEVPSWTELSVSPPRFEEEPEPNLPRQGWAEGHQTIGDSVHVRRGVAGSE